MKKHARNQSVISKDGLSARGPRDINSIPQTPARTDEDESFIAIGSYKSVIKKQKTKSAFNQISKSQKDSCKETNNALEKISESPECFNDEERVNNNIIEVNNQGFVKPFRTMANKENEDIEKKTALSADDQNSSFLSNSGNISLIGTAIDTEQTHSITQNSDVNLADSQELIFQFDD